MTGRNLVEFIKANNLEDFQIEVQFRDDGGCYHGTDKKIEPTILKAGTSMRYSGYADYNRVIL